ncbi:hypothetical protein MPTK2_3g17033 [Marchantia polymorpha subsp. ruderalis]
MESVPIDIIFNMQDCTSVMLCNDLKMGSCSCTGLCSVDSSTLSMFSRTPEHLAICDTLLAPPAVIPSKMVASLTRCTISSSFCSPLSPLSALLFPSSNMAKVWRLCGCHANSL